jgi:hypothetical protein
VTWITHQHTGILSRSWGQACTLFIASSSNSFLGRPIFIDPKYVEMNIRPVFRNRIPKFFGHPDLLVRGTDLDSDPAPDPDSPIIKQK